MSISDKQMNRADDNYIEAGFREIDRRMEAQDAENEMIDSRVADMWADKEKVCNAVMASLDGIDLMSAHSHDVAKGIERIIDGFFEVEVKDELGI